MTTSRTLITLFLLLAVGTATGQTRPRPKRPARPSPDKPRIIPPERDVWAEFKAGIGDQFPADARIDVGDTGRFGKDWRVRVVQVIDDMNVLVETTRTNPGYSANELAWLRLPTAGMVDGRMVLAKDIDSLTFKATGTTTYKTATSTKTVLVFEKVNVKERDEVAKPPTAEQAGGKEKATVGPTRWINESYATVIRRVKDKLWEEVDKNTQKTHWQLKEVERTDEHVVVFNAERKETWRLGAEKMEIKKDGKWEWIATGHWEEAKP